MRFTHRLQFHRAERVASDNTPFSLCTVMVLAEDLPYMYIIQQNILSNDGGLALFSICCYFFPFIFPLHCPSFVYICMWVLCRVETKKYRVRLSERDRNEAGVRGIRQLYGDGWFYSFNNHFNRQHAFIHRLQSKYPHICRCDSRVFDMMC